jgi:hypothetical protein
MLAGLLVLFLPLSGKGQQNSSGTVQAGAFSTDVSSDQVNIYFSADLLQLPVFFERAFFLQLVFADTKMVVNNSNISGATLEIFSSRENDPVQIKASLEVYRNQALEAEKNMPADQKKELVNKYEKFR